jgi:methionyl-tRNA formyltransferase
MLKVVFMGTPQFAVPALEALLATQQVVGVVTQPDKPAGRGRQLQFSPVKATAVAANIPVYQPVSLRSETAVDPIRAWRPDIIVVAAFGQILRPHLLELPPHGCLNVHASLLPRWRGASPIQRAILAGDEETGVCLMRMEAGLDTGPVYVCGRTAIAADDTAASLHDRLAMLGADLLRDHLDGIVDGRYPPAPQEDAYAAYAPMIKKEEGQIDWRQTAVAIDRHTRAMTPWPGAFTHWQGKLLKIKRARPAAELNVSGEEAGRVTAVDERLIISTGEGKLELLELQLEGKRSLPAAEFLRGYPAIVAANLGNS